MTKAEELATRLYPIEIDTRWGPLPGGGISEVDVNKVERLACIKGYEAAQKDLGWKSVDEELPPMDEEVIVLTNRVRNIEFPSADRICFAHIVDKSLAVDWDGWNIPGVKFWMHNPELPKKK